MQIFGGYYREWTFETLVLGVVWLASMYGAIGLGSYGVWMVIRGRPAPNDRTAFLILCALLVANVLGIAALLYFRWEWRQNRREAPGVITDSGGMTLTTEVQDRDANNNVSYRTNVDVVLAIDYEYTGPDGKLRHGKILGESGLDTGKTTAELAKMYTLGAKVPVWYHVNNPDMSTLNPYPKHALLNTVIGFIVMLAIFCGYSYGYYRITEWYATRPPPAEPE